jgi:hypothetical protein
VGNPPLPGSGGDKGLARLDLNNCNESKSDAGDLVLKTHHAASIPVYLGPMLYIVLEVLSLEKLETKLCKFGKNAVLCAKKVIITSVFVI